MNILQCRAFSTELLKIAAEVTDAELREMKAIRKGDEYLKGGKLPSNEDEPINNQYIPKTASTFNANNAAQFMSESQGRGKSRKVKIDENPYMTGRDYAMGALKGGVTGVSAAAFSRAMKHSKKPKSYDLSHGHFRAAGAAGAAIGVADVAYRRHLAKKQLKAQAGMNKKAVLDAKNIGLSSRTFSPARQAFRDRSVGHFENKIHASTGSLKRNL